MRRPVRCLFAALALSLLPGIASALEEKGAEGDVQPYDDVITEDAVTRKGLFTTHRVGEKLYFEIPPAQLDVDMLWVTQIARTQAGSSYAGMPAGNRVVRWESRDETILLRDVKYSIQRAVEATSLSPILQALPVVAWGKDRAPVVDVTSLFTGDLPEFSVKEAMNASGVDGSRSFVDEVKAFPTNVETKALLTYRLKDDARNKQDGKQSAVTVQLHHSMVRLPDDPMRPRRQDERVGFFSGSFQDYGEDANHAVERISYIRRWRLEKADPDAELSEPLEPIVFYVGREVPEKWRPWVHRGIEAWQPAFEKAGFEKAIVAKDAPSEREDPDWDAEDVRYSTIRWLPSDVENAFGPHVADPRTGEILEADVRMYHNVLKLVRDWYFVQASPSDPRAQELPLPDDLVGELVAYVVAHEVGHSLGFPHNMKASSAYTVENLRDPDFTRKFGVEASIMDYGRFNYVAQPGDGATLIPVVGPYDHFAVEWGYRQFPDAGSWEDEKALLDGIVARQLTDPMLLFGHRNAFEDPSQQTEDLGSDPIAATTLGMANVDRVAGYLVEATCERNEDYDLLENMYGELIAQRNRELGHVASLVGGFVTRNLFYGDAERRFHPAPVKEQRAAIAFLNEHAFRTPSALVDTDITLRLSVSGVADRILSGQERLQRTLVNAGRIDRMAEHATWDGQGTYLGTEMLGDLTNGIWSELGSSPVTIDLYRRNLQRAHVELLVERMLDEDDAGSDLPALCRGELRAILEALPNAQAGAADRTTALHLADVEARIEEALDPRAEDSLLQAVEAAARR